MIHWAYLKGVCHDIFDIQFFFHDRIHLGPWFTKKFCLSPRRFVHHGDNFVIEYLDETETEFENILACLSGVQMGLKLWIMKKLEVKNLVTHSF